MKIQEYLEEAIQDIFQARTYLSTNSIPCVRYSDFSTDREGLCVVVRCSNVNRVAPNYNYYECVFEVSAVSYVQSDLVKTSFDALMADVNDAVFNDITKTALQTAVNAVSATSGMTIDGIVNLDASDLDNETFYIGQITTNIYLTFTPS